MGLGTELSVGIRRCPRIPAELSLCFLGPNASLPALESTAIELAVFWMTMFG